MTPPPSHLDVGSCSLVASESLVPTLVANGLTADLEKVLHLVFQFSWGNTVIVTDTRTCNWNHNTNGCHAIWHQPLMMYHNGYANYQTHTHCEAG
ncbi:hypothetical protein NQ176_g937 [Zarea fungicola]|uniref:Uncharacterized protein n=1 Tax=Zarea fungicola TaxID=93591 RepID=A0ACC1NUW4_9HYPO|nr:hypothetical protein NQ176_g937 [Lecanicillium fungicola]